MTPAGGTMERDAPFDRRMVIAAMALLFLADVLMRPFVPHYETHYLSVAWEMYLNHNWLVPTSNWQPYSHKPPLLFWLMNLVWLPGVTETAARLIAPAFCLLGLWLTGRLGERMGGRRVGDAAVMILASLGPFYFFGGRATFDAMLMVSTLLAALALWRIGTRDIENRGLAPWLGLGAALALGIHSKGPVILLHVAPMLLGLRWWAGAGRFSWRGLGAALALALVLVGLWLVPALIAADATWREEVLWGQSAGRVVNSFAQKHPFWYYLPVLPVLLFPWIFLTDFWRRRPLDAAERLLWLWAAGGLVLLSVISAKNAHYALPEMPAAALILARRWPERLSRPWAALVGLGVLFAGLVALALGAFGDGQAALVPLWILPVMALPLVAAGLAMRRRPRLVFLVIPALALALDLGYAIGPAGKIMSPKTIARRLTPFDGRIAITNYFASADFIFAGRLKQPITMLGGAGAFASFAAAGPEGRIVAPLYEGSVPDWEPLETLRYGHEGFYGIWSTERR